MEILKRKFSLEEINSGDIQIGDVIELPEFTVPEAIIRKKQDLTFNPQIIKDSATVYNIKNGMFYLIFNHALFMSPIDLNNERNWGSTQLGYYLETVFKRNMINAKIPTEHIFLPSKGEMFGVNALSFFKDGKNRTAFDNQEKKSVFCWLRTLDRECSKSTFYHVGPDGSSDGASRSYMNLFVRPCFIISL